MASNAPSRVEKAYHSIKERILSGALAPGAPLSESRLGTQLRTSRTPIREALSRLLEEGCVERVAGRGYFVAPVTVTLIRDTFEVRRLLEGAAASRTAEQADAPAVRRLRTLAEFHYRVGDPKSYQRATEANTDFHMAIATASGNALLVDLTRYCLSQVTRFIALGVSIDRLQDTASAHHHAIVDAIERGQPAEARRAMEIHLDDSSRQMMEALLHGGSGAITVEGSEELPAGGA